MTNLVSMNLPVTTVVGPVPPGDPDVTSDASASFATLLSGAVTTDAAAAPSDKRDKLADAVDAKDASARLQPVPVDPNALAIAAAPMAAMAALAVAPAPTPASTQSPAAAASQGTVPAAHATTAIDTTTAIDATTTTTTAAQRPKVTAAPDAAATAEATAAAGEASATHVATTEDAAGSAAATVPAPVATALAELSRANGKAKENEPAKPTATVGPSVTANPIAQAVAPAATPIPAVTANPIAQPVLAAASSPAVTTDPNAQPVALAPATHGTGAADTTATTSYAAVAPLVAPAIATHAGSPIARATTDTDAPTKAADTTAAPVTGLAGGPTAPTTFAPSAAALPTPAAELRSFPEIQQPLVASLARLRSHAGTHALTVHLHPADLGAVSVNATIRDGALMVSVACADQDAHSAVLAALPNLHQELKNAGFSGVDVSLGNQPQPQARQWLAEHGHAGNPISTPEQPDASGPQPVTTVHRRPTPNAGIDRWM
jgi:flagellar hook-length control protein FliK